MKKTKIIATVGPACKKQSVLKEMIREGIDILRINVSHTTPQTLEQWINHIRQLDKIFSRRIPILVDLQGPRVRTGKLAHHKPILLEEGQEIVIAIGDFAGSKEKIVTSCREFQAMVKAGDRIMLDNGSMELETLKVTEKWIRCRIIRGGTLGENKGINLPNAPVTLPALSKEDIAHLKVACRLNVDFIALSFVRSDEDIDTLKRWLKRHGKDIPVIAKIEKPRALQHIEAIFSQANGIMVARGDLGIEMGLEKVPPIQKDLIDRANQNFVPVITATQMLESMIENSNPTRAEVSDVANAVYDGTDAVMLSGETAIGRFPVEAVRIMSETILEAETNERFLRKWTRPEKEGKTVSSLHAISRAAYLASQALGAQAIIVFTVSGKTAVMVSKLRPNGKVIALTTSQRVAARLALLHGVQSLVIRHSKNTDEMIYSGDKAVVKADFLKKGDLVVILSGKQAFTSARYMTKIHEVGEL